MRRISDAIEAIAYGFDEDDFDVDEDFECCGHS
jgi:hypothetical protein